MVSTRKPQPAGDVLEITGEATVVLTSGPRTRGRWLEAAAYAVAALVPLGVILLLVRPWEHGLGVPITYVADGLLTGAVIKGVLRNGWWLVNPAIGAPGVMNLYDFPGADTLHYLAIRFLGLFSADWSTVMNALYLLGYPAAGLSATFALRRLGVSRLPAACGGLLFALLPYHWWRGEAHLFLGLYIVVPLLVLLAFWMASDHVPLLAMLGEGPAGWDLRSKRSLGAILICVMGAMSGVYYAFFGAFLIVLCAVRAAIASREKRVALAGLALAAVIALTAFAQAAPNLVLARAQGTSRSGVSRNPGQAEVFGLKVTQLFLPADGHRLPLFAKLKQTYRTGLQQMGPYLDNEGNSAALGVLGALGFLASLLAFAFGRGGPRDDLLRTAGFVNLGALLLATVGGFGAMVAVVLPQIRAYNRISVFIAFASIAALCALADRALARQAKGLARTAAVAAVVAITALAILDQTPPALAVPASRAAAYSADAAFVTRVVSALPSGTAVFQMPYMPFPEPGGRFYGMSDYDPLRGYLHADGLRWSYGAPKGRSDDAWQKATAALPAREMVRELRSRGFGAVWVQLNGYADSGSEVKADIDSELGPPIATSPDGAFAVWRL